jgi:tetratricopeptide (TPR) repeat protein
VTPDARKAVQIPPSGPPTGLTHWAWPVVLAVVCAIVLGTFAWIVGAGGSELGPTNAADAHYNRLVDGFRSGMLSLKREAPPGLAQLPDPYDPQATAPYRYSREGLHDLSYYRGRLYLYFGITPALVLFWPSVALTGHYLSHQTAVAIFCAVGFLAGVGLLGGIWRRYFPEVGAGVAAAGALALGLATSVPLMLQRPAFYEVAVSCGYALIMLALAAVWRALHAPARRGWWLTAASLLYGLAVGARPSLLPGAVILLIPVAAIASAPSAGDRRRFCWSLLAAAVGPMILVGLGLMLYNQLRFDSPFEFGQRYQLAGDRQAAVRHFSLDYLWYNFRLYFLAPLRWNRAFPFVTDLTPSPAPSGHAEVVENPLGLLISVPLVWLALAVPLGWRERTAEARALLRWFVAAVTLVFISGAAVICLFYTTSNRYEIEFAPALVLLAVVGLLAIERARQTWPPFWRHAARWTWSVLLAFSVVINLLASVDRYALECYSLGRFLLESGQPAEAVVKFQASLRVKPGYADAYNKLGVALLQTDRIAEAIPQFRRALLLEPDNPPAHLNLGTALAVSDRNAEAAAQFEQALRLQPDNPSAHLNLGILLARSGRLNEAIEHLTAGVRLKPDDAELHASLGSVLLQAGRTAEAIAEYREALRLRPDDAEVRASLERAEARLRASGDEQ